ncbi:MAG: hypothetical protein ACYCSO_08625 [Cuniculiplasma sp.]
MRLNLTLILSIILGYLFILIFYSGVAGLLGESFLVVLVIFFSLSLLPIFQEKKIEEKRISPMKFLPVILIGLSIIFSSGYLYSPFPYFRMLSRTGSGNISFFLVLMLFSVIGIMSLETHKNIQTPLIVSGYDRDEIEREMNLFTKSVAMIGLFSLLAGLGIDLLLEGGPDLDIGLVPAIIIFFVVYAFVITSAVRKES